MWPCARPLLLLEAGILRSETDHIPPIEWLFVLVRVGTSRSTTTTPVTRRLLLTMQTSGTSSILSLTIRIMQISTEHAFMTASPGAHSLPGIRLVEVHILGLFMFRRREIAVALRVIGTQYNRLIHCHNTMDYKLEQESLKSRESSNKSL